MRLSDVKHQERALSILRRALRSGRTHHAYLFEGPEGVGRKMTGHALAARLLCQDQRLAADDDACGECRSCRLLAGGNHPDFHLIHRGLHKLHPDRSIRTSKGLFLAVDLIRFFLIEPASSTPSLGLRRVFLLRDAERMNEQAQNALLKTLEEPPGATCLILVTSSAERLLPTIRSRCQRVPFDLLPPAFIERQLTSRLELAPDEARALSRLADGRLGVALRWHRLGLPAVLDQVGACLEQLSADDPESFGRRMLEIATNLASRELTLCEPTADGTSAATGSDEAESVAESSGEDEELETGRSSARTVPTDALRDGLKRVLMLTAVLYRDALVTCVGAEARRHVPQQQRRSAGLADQATADQLEDSLHAIVRAERMLDRNVAPQLTCEWLAVALRERVPAR